VHETQPLLDVSEGFERFCFCICGLVGCGKCGATLIPLNKFLMEGFGDLPIINGVLFFRVVDDIKKLAAALGHVEDIVVGRVANRALGGLPWLVHPGRHGRQIRDRSSVEHRGYIQWRIRVVGRPRAGLGLYPRQAEYGRTDIHCTNNLVVLHSGGNGRRIANQQGNVEPLIIELLVHKFAVIEELLSMICRDNDNRIVEGSSVS